MNDQLANTYEDKQQLPYYSYLLLQELPPERESNNQAAPQSQADNKNPQSQSDNNKKWNREH